MDKTWLKTCDGFPMSSSWMLLKMVWKLNGRDEQGPPKRCGDLEGA